MTKAFNFSETEMLASVPSTGDDRNKKEEDRTVAVIVTIDEELVRRIETSLHRDTKH